MFLDVFLSSGFRGREQAMEHWCICAALDATASAIINSPLIRSHAPYRPDAIAYLIEVWLAFLM